MSDYIICENCEGHEDGWSVKVNERGDVTALECRDCGGSELALVVGALAGAATGVGIGMVIGAWVL